MKFFIFLIPALLMLASCRILSVNEEDQDLTGKEWTIIAIAQKPVDLDKKAFFKLDEKGKIGGKAACNSFSGSYEKGANNQIRFSDIVSTKMYCEGLMDEENQIVMNLQQVKNYKVKTGMLYLFNGSELLLTLKR
ncbi:META domain-containing protein [Rubrolithibacter danxiaensis]|uniref:META domain-containing protein n=1 Tax=Rubrolithibacter danxiaensis TaxID=3390805 RepID=UPI003BF88615